MARQSLKLRLAERDLLMFRLRLRLRAKTFERARADTLQRQREL